MLLDIAEVQTADGKQHLFVAIDRTSKFAFVELHREAGKMVAARLRDFINAYKYGRRVMTLRGLTPYEYICKCWTSEPERSNPKPHRQMPRPKI